MVGDGYTCLDPNLIVAGVEKITPERHDIPFVWAKAVNFTTQADTYIPKQLVDMPYIQLEGEALLRVSITTGAACGNSLQDAVKRGFLELVERDAFMLSWLTQTGLSEIDICGSKISQNTLLYHSLNEVNRYQLKPYFYRMVSFENIPAVVCVLKDDADVGVPFSVGAKCSDNFESAMLGALEESIQLRHWLRTIHTGELQGAEQPNSLIERGLLTQTPKYQESLDEWINASCENTEINFNDLKSEHSINYPSDLFFIDLSHRKPEKLKAHKFAVAKCIVPSFQPLYLTETLSDLAWSRILPRLKNKTINPIPHPFL